MRRENLFAVLYILLAVLMVSAAPSQVAAQELGSQPVYQFRLEKDIMVPMRDGTTLATDIYFPETDEPVPALVMRTPYNKDGSSRYGEYYASRGYAVVVQDVRGRYKSNGVFYNYLNDGYDEHKDGYDGSPRHSE